MKLFHHSSPSGPGSTPHQLASLGGWAQTGGKILIIIPSLIISTALVDNTLTISITSNNLFRKALATIALISIAAGEVIGGATFGFFGHLTAK